MIESPYLTDKTEFIAKLRKIPAFAHLSDEALQRVLSLTKIRKYKAGETIVKEGVFDCWIHVILTGDVELRRGSTVIMRLRRSGDMIGEMGIFDGTVRETTTVALKPTVCLAMDACCVDGLNSSDKNAFFSVVYRLIAELLACRLKKTETELNRLRGT